MSHFLAQTWIELVRQLFYFFSLLLHKFSVLPALLLDDLQQDESFLGGVENLIRQIIKLLFSLLKLILQFLYHFKVRLSFGLEHFYQGRDIGGNRLSSNFGTVYTESLILFYKVAKKLHLALLAFCQILMNLIQNFLPIVYLMRNSDCVIDLVLVVKSA